MPSESNLMNNHRAVKSSRIALVGLILAAAVSASVAQGRTDADRLEEIEYWRSAATINTVQAYEGYLARYKDGAFAALAAAALAKVNTPDVGERTGATDAHEGNFVGLKELDELSSSSSVEYPIGTRLLGPGTIRVGSLGSRIQVVIPAGSWVFLGSADYYRTYSASVPMTSAAFGQVSNGVVVSVLLVQMTRGPIAALASGWHGLGRCQSQADSPDLTVAPNHRRVQVCGRIVQLPTPAVGSAPDLATWDLALRSIAKIGAQIAKFNSRIEVNALGTGNRYIEYAKYECAEQSGAPATCGAAGRFALGAGKQAEPARIAKEKWVREYSFFAAEGALNDLDIADITPRQSPPK